jgi:hypothetical protein
MIFRQLFDKRLQHLCLSRLMGTLKRDNPKLTDVAAPTSRAGGWIALFG